MLNGHEIQHGRSLPLPTDGPRVFTQVWARGLPFLEISWDTRMNISRGGAGQIL